MRDLKKYAGRLVNTISSCNINYVAKLVPYEDKLHPFLKVF